MTALRKPIEVGKPLDPSDKEAVAAFQLWLDAIDEADRKRSVRPMTKEMLHRIVPGHIARDSYTADDALANYQRWQDREVLRTVKIALCVLALVGLAVATVWVLLP